MERSNEMQTEKRNMIVEAAYKLFIKKGLEKTSIRDIANLADVNVNTLYYYFRTKAEIIICCVEYGLEKISKDIFVTINLKGARQNGELKSLLDYSLKYKEELCWCYQVITSPNYNWLVNGQMQMELFKLIGDLDDYMGTNLSFDGGSSHPNGNNYSNGSSNYADDELELSSSGGNIFDRIFRRNDSLDKSLKGVEHKPIERAREERTEQQIISSISGGDMTAGSCSSLALAYAGNRAGYVVYDFRDGQSRQVFSTRRSIEQIANLEGVNSVILRGTDDTLCVEQLMSRMETGREYYMATGAHAAIVRLNDEGHYQYLELQSGIPSNNGWQPLTLNALSVRFGCEDGQTTECSNYLIELDSLQSNTEFLNLLGYINTDESAQARGASGHER